MFQTPKTNRKITSKTQISTQMSKNSNFSPIRTNHHIKSYQSIQASIKSQKQLDKIQPVAKLLLKLTKNKITSHSPIRDSPTLKVNQLNYKSQITTKMSSQTHGNVIAYGISTFKGYRNVINPHFFSLNFGQLNHVTFSESFDGQIAAKLIKDQFRAEMANLVGQFHKKSMENIDETIRQTFRRIQFKVSLMQQRCQDNSGSTLISVIIHDKYFIAANAGSSQIVCFTKNKNLIKLSNPHTISNENERKRIIKNGGTIYQTVVNVPYQNELQIHGPLRIAPYGLTYTRCLGKGLDYAQQIKKISTEHCCEEDQLNVTWKPECMFLNTDQVQWFGIFSEQVIKNCSLQFIQQCVETQMKKKSQQYSQHHIAESCSRKIIEKLINQGIGCALSCVIVLLTHVQPVKKVVHPTALSLALRTQNLIQGQTVKTTLTYSGNRRSFFKSVSVSSSKANSLNKRYKTNNQQSEISSPKLSKEFSFNSFH